jgi:hypothetical protein
MSVLGIYERG